MAAPHSLSCLLLLTLGACLPPPDRRDAGAAGPGHGGLRADEAGPAAAGGAPRRRRGPEAAPLLVAAKKLQGLGKERAGFRFRFGRQEAADHAARGPLAGGEKRPGLLGSLAEELSGYSRSKGGFRFRFGRR